jgi:DNA-binding MarR family transcriptional regulator
VVRNRSADDRRRVQVELTADGKKEACKLREITDAAIAAVLQRIPKAKHKQVLESIALIRQAMDEAREELKSCCSC